VSVTESQHPAPAASSSAASDSPMAQPATFTSTAEDCSGLLLHCSLYLEAQSQLFTTEQSRVAFVISLLARRALQWAQPLWESNAPVTPSINSFFTHFWEVFGQSTAELSIHDQIFNLRQGDESVSMYALHFGTLETASGRNETALITAFRHGLNPHVKQLMVVYDDNPMPATPSVALPGPEAMQVDSYRLTRAERQRRATSLSVLWGRGPCDRCLSHPSTTPSGEYYPTARAHSTSHENACASP